MSDELKPCPFCGSRADRIDFGPGDAENAGGSCIACSHCGSSGPVEFGYKENFISNWNRRTQPPAVGVDVSDEMVERAFRKSKSGGYETEREQMRAALHAALRTGGGA